MYQIYSLHHFWPDTGAVRMRIGEPLRFPEGQNYEEVAQEIEKAVTELGSPLASH